jgi:hypothetical protein
MKETAFENVSIKEETETESKPAAVASPEKKIRPTTPVNNADYEKKEKQRAKFVKVQEKVEAKKSEAATKFKSGNYIEAN